MTSRSLFTQTTKPSQSVRASSPMPSPDGCIGNAILDPESGAEKRTRKCLLIDEPIVRAALRRMAARMESDFHSRQDLNQEALLHLWLLERQRPGQQVGWYLQSAKFHLQHLVNRGRSVDSRKHSAAMMASPADYQGIDEEPHCLEFDEGIMSEVNVRDILSLLAERLGKLDRSILCGLAGGLGPREIAKGVQVSHVSVVQHRRKIASVAIKLGVEPFPGCSQSAS